MELDWNYVKGKTLWHYDDLIKKLGEVLGYAFVGQFYSHSMLEAADFAKDIRGGYLQDRDDSGFLDGMRANFLKLSERQVIDYNDLVQQVGLFLC